MPALSVLVVDDEPSVREAKNFAFIVTLSWRDALVGG